MNTQSRNVRFQTKKEAITAEVLSLFPAWKGYGVRIGIFTGQRHLTKVVVQGIIPIQSAREEGASDTP